MGHPSDVWTGRAWRGTESNSSASQMRRSGPREAVWLFKVTQLVCAGARIRTQQC